jgi:Holliday junction DNA helicase RuvA
MIASLRGTLQHKDTQGAVIECGGVGYGVAMSLASLARLPDVGTQVFVLVCTHVTQDSLRLFAFSAADEQAAFEILLNTTGVGPRLALAILSTLSPQELADTVARADKTALTQIPGVGSKKAERLLVELKGRLVAAPLTAAGQGPSATLADLHSAMMNLGFAPAVAEKAARFAVERSPGETDLTQLVRDALRSTTARGAS